MNDVILGVHRRASSYKHLIFVLDRADPTARELLRVYAPRDVQLSSDSRDRVDVIALLFGDGLRLLRTPEHGPEQHVFHVVANQLVVDRFGKTFGICVSGGGFVRFTIGSKMELN
jgi:hypothetical protein